MLAAWAVWCVFGLLARPAQKCAAAAPTSSPDSSRAPAGVVAYGPASATLASPSRLHPARRPVLATDPMLQATRARPGTTQPAAAGLATART